MFVSDGERLKCFGKCELKLCHLMSVLQVNVLPKVVAIGHCPPSQCSLRSQRKCVCTKFSQLLKNFIHSMSRSVLVMEKGWSRWRSWISLNLSCHIWWLSPQVSVVPKVVATVAALEDKAVVWRCANRSLPSRSMCSSISNPIGMDRIQPVCHDCISWIA